ncbi:ABC-2 transporter permease [Longicatena caecimuris]|uniref:ABC-2 transporter permease n=1 Tax=Longicatena caecimuris TaxID=1796635 RepID=UPI0018ABF04C|nr:ABC-2 transporter permease [Longicatena caecimuris]
MKGLLIKDFKLMKGQKNFFMVIIVISIIMIIASPESSFPIGFLGFIGTLFSISSISYDEFDNGNAFLFSLPITRKDYVFEKYVFGFITGVTSLLLGTVMSLISIGITKTGSFNEIFITASSLFPIILLILSIMLPFILKFGGEKGRIAIIGVMGFIFVIGLLLIKVTDKMGIDLYGIFKNLPQFQPQVYILLLLLCSGVVLVISYFISLAIMKKKEF